MLGSSAEEGRGSASWKSEFHRTDMDNANEPFGKWDEFPYLSFSSF